VPIPRVQDGRTAVTSQHYGQNIWLYGMEAEVWLVEPYEHKASYLGDEHYAGRIEIRDVYTGKIIKSKNNVTKAEELGDVLREWWMCL